MVKLLDQNKIWCGIRYGLHDYDSGDKKTKRQKGKKAIRQKDKKAKITTTKKHTHTHNKMCGQMCGKIEKLLDQNKIWCGIRYELHDYDSGDKNHFKINYYRTK